jgi:hypothetical protein
MTAAEVLEQLQADIAAVLMDTSALADAQVLIDNAGDIEAQVDKALGPLSAGPTGKPGLVLIVLLPEVSATEPNLPGPPMQATCEVQVIERPLLNRTETGTNLRSSAAAVLALNALHHYTVGNRMLVPGETPIRPFRSATGTVSHILTLGCRLAGLAEPTRPGNCNAAWLENDTLRLACASGAADIWYTTDGSYPSPGNAEAALYTGPIAGLEVGDRVRCAGWLPDLNPGNVLELTITADTTPGEIYWDGWGPTWDNL